MKTLVCVILIFMILGCAATGQMTRSTATAPKKLDPGELYLKWVILLPIYVLVGIPSGALFKTEKEVEQMTLGEERRQQKEEKGKKEKGQKWLKY